jgi:hypothetical protein
MNAPIYTKECIARSLMSNLEEETKRRQLLLTTPPHFILTGLQPGDSAANRSRNRFNGLLGAAENR